MRNYYEYELRKNFDENVDERCVIAEQTASDVGMSIVPMAIVTALLLMAGFTANLHGITVVIWQPIEFIPATDERNAIAARVPSRPQPAPKASVRKSTRAAELQQQHADADKAKDLALRKATAYATSLEAEIARLEAQAARLEAYATLVMKKPRDFDDDALSLKSASEELTGSSMDGLDPKYRTGRRSLPSWVRMRNDAARGQIDAAIIQGIDRAIRSPYSPMDGN